MGKTIYVDGSIVVKTKFFVPKEIGCGFLVPPEGAEVMEAKDVVEGVKCLLIDDDHPQSLFNEYYARGDVSFGEIATSYLSASYIECINVYKTRINEVCIVVRRVADWPIKERTLVYKMAYVNILSALDAFICYVLLRRCSREERLFNNLVFYLAPKSKQDAWRHLKERGLYGKWEQEAIRQVLEKSFVNTATIDKTIKLVELKPLEYSRERMEQFFRIRHLIVHRNGRQKDDTECEVSYQVLADLINDCHTLVGAIFDSICITVDQELKTQPKERDLEEVFPGGVVRAPFKLSDLSRFLMQKSATNDFEPIEMPVL